MNKLMFALAALILPASMSFAADNAFLKTPIEVTQDELNAISILSRDSNEVFFPNDSVLRIAAEISAIKTQYSEVKNINDYFAFAGSYTTALLSLTDETMASLLPMIQKAADLPQTIDQYKSGRVDVSSLVNTVDDLKAVHQLVPIESLFANYSVSRTSPFHVTFMVAELRYLVNIQALAKVVAPYKELRYLESNGLVGDGNRILRKETSANTVEYIFAVGDGDCLAGCTEWKTYRFAYDPETKTATKTGEDNGYPR